MSRADLKHWLQLWHALGAVGDPATEHQRLIAAYSEQHRHYHNLQHLDECLRELDSARALAAEPAVVEAALWFHDGVYDPRSSTNEDDSAILAHRCFSVAGLPSDRLDEINQLIVCTKTHQPGRLPDAALLIDIDLAILGQPASRFIKYEHDIKAEYRWVPDAIYVQKRTEILAGFLRRPAIYHTTYFKNRYEPAARENLQRAIDALAATGS